jgi:hypothetical protein
MNDLPFRQRWRARYETYRLGWEIIILKKLFYCNSINMSHISGNEMSTQDIVHYVPISYMKSKEIVHNYYMFRSIKDITVLTFKQVALFVHQALCIQRYKYWTS